MYKSKETVTVYEEINTYEHSKRKRFRPGVRDKLSLLTIVEGDARVLFQ